jgi:hypothetical protein
MNLSRSLHIVRCLLGLMLVFALPGCKTIDPIEVTNFATSVTAVKTQTGDALNATAGLTRDASINYAASQPKLNEANFVETPTGDTISEWQDAFAAIEAYAQNLSALLSPDASKNFDVAATNLFNQFNQTAGRLKANSINSQAGLNALLATAFAETANLIIKARQETKVVEIASTTDTNIASICALFAREIGADRVTSPGLRRTVYEAVWTPRLSALTQPFLETNSAGKLAISQEYADMLAKRDAQDQILASLRRSILALSAAHHKLAQGKPASIQSDLTIIAGEIQHTRELYAQFSGLTKK